MRKISFANGEYYHIYNRGVDKRRIFSDKKDYQRFLLSIDLLNDNKDGLMENWRNLIKVNPKARLSERVSERVLKIAGKRKPLVEFVAYCINPNHYHFILKQVTEKGIERFMHKLGTSYTKYFNKKNKRSGVLFQGKFKATHIDSNEYLLYLSAYVNNNYFIHGYSQKDREYSSREEYKTKNKKGFCNKQPILSQFGKKIGDYGDFMKKNSLYMRKKKELEKYLIEE
ncbi:MAG TPA: hypothetical protein ENG89_01500 [Candidatus Moranbacteria bacterium]|nr:hypothetical protein [Candidatus Moranbacteria bacterium]